MKEHQRKITIPQKNVIKNLLKIKNYNKLKRHTFWSNQPVPVIEEVKIDKNGPLEIKTIRETRKRPFNLPIGFEWYPMNLEKEVDLDDFHSFLSEHYIEDDDSMFRFNYSKDFLRWALMPPNFLNNWHLTVRIKKNKKIVASITAIPANIRVYDKFIKMVEINFLCVHKKLRDKRMTPVLIKEITRRVNCKGIFQATYTAGVVIPRPISKNQYWHYLLNPKKLVETGFSSIQKNSTIGRMIRLSKVPFEMNRRLRKMTKIDCLQVCELLKDYLEKFKYAPILGVKEISHWLLPRQNVVYSYVLESNKGLITDFISFYCLSSHVVS